MIAQPPDDEQAIKALLEVMRTHDLDALTVRTGETTYELIRRPDHPVTTVVTAAAAADVPAAAPADVPAASNYRTVTAPIIGVFYRSSSPGTDPFVEVGDRVEVGTTLCILEAMKQMNEITCEHAGIIRRVLPDNGALVSLGEELFWIEP